MEFQIKNSIWEDFKNNPEKYNFNFVPSAKVYEYKQDYLNGKLWVYKDRTLEATHYLDNVDRRAKIIREVSNSGIIQIKK